MGTLLGDAIESFKAFAVPGHRHLQEIRQGLHLSTVSEVGLTFLPHLTPMIRGIHANLYAELSADIAGDLQQLFESRSESEHFVEVLPTGSHPETRSVSGANTSRNSNHRPKGANTEVFLSVIDKQVNGAAGQAVQNMNIMFGLSETSGLDNIALLP